MITLTVEITDFSVTYLAEDETGLNGQNGGNEQNFSLERTSKGCETRQRGVGTHSRPFTAPA